MELPFARLHPDAVLPVRMTAFAAGCDLAACLGADESMTIAPGRRALVPTGWALAIPAGYEGQVRPRSGLAWKHGVTVVNAPGTIDADYRGELRVALINTGDTSYAVAHGDRIAQLVVTAVVMPTLVEVDALPDVGATSQGARGTGGFGSTGA